MLQLNTKKKDNLPLFLFHQGTNFDAYRFLGAHYEKRNGADGYVFRTWAPNASSVSVVGSFNEWDIEANPMSKISGGVYECFIEGVKRYDAYKF
ncbi:MAG: 1,4-alpha-glucan branching enzyme, partial [Oscillospiraceae bacterium]